MRPRCTKGKGLCIISGAKSIACQHPPKDQCRRIFNIISNTWRSIIDSIGYSAAPLSPSSRIRDRRTRQEMHRLASRFASRFEAEKYRVLTPIMSVIRARLAGLG
jgi:hypothetical protein